MTVVDDVKVFAVVLGVLAVTFGIAFAVIMVTGAVTRRRERRRADLLGHVRRPMPHRRFRTVRGYHHG